MKYRQIFINIIVSLLWVYFSWLFLSSFLITHKPSTLIFFATDTATVIFFLFRRDPLFVSAKPFDWFIAIVGSFFSLLFRPAAGFFLFAEILTGIGSVLQLSGILSLNRSFGIVPANRGIKQNGAYQFVRHPMYLGAIIFCLGYFLANVTLWNGVVFAFIIMAQITRIINEEEFFAKDEAYIQYKAKVRWRLIPYVF
ncbi:MAG: methyltransferase [Candidatus Paceibacterota bacterium]|jgi:protein-S-isoprenylcysteine O-methyltransferase Ste14|nr:DUF1295 domain-containing protein [Candidatus Paceibacterota bacterium]